MSTAVAPEFGVAPLGMALIEDPVAFLSAEHGRQMALLAHLDRLARAPAARGARHMATALLRWLTEELPIHIADEEQSLYPRLHAHDQDGAIARLAVQRRREARLIAETNRGLRRLAAGDDAGRTFPMTACDFTRLHRQQLDFEEATVTPLARAVLTGEAAAALAAEMAKRRGIKGPRTCPKDQ